MNNEPNKKELVASKITAVLADLVGIIPSASEGVDKNAGDRAREIARKTALRAATLSGTLAIPPGVLGIVTIIPDLMGIWRLQRQMVADVAGVFGTSAELRTESMIYCLFKHGSAAVTRDLVVRVGERILIRDASIKSMQVILNRIGVNISERVITRSLSRFIPLVGAAGLGAYAYYDTTRVAATAIELFSPPRSVVAPR